MSNQKLAVDLNPVHDLVKDWDIAELNAAQKLILALSGVYKLISSYKQLEIEEQDKIKAELREYAEELEVKLGNNDSLERILVKIFFSSRSDNRKACYTNIMIRGLNNKIAFSYFESWLSKLGVEEAGKKLKVETPKKTLDIVTLGYERLSKAKPIHCFDKLDSTPNNSGRAIAICNIRKDGTTELIGYTSDELIVSKVVEKVGQDEIKLDYALVGNAKEQALLKAKSNVLNQFELLPNYTGIVTANIAKAHKPECIKQFVFPTDESDTTFRMWALKSSSQVLFIEGPNGTGKSSLSLIAPTVLYPEIECKISEVNLNQSLSKIASTVEKLVEDIPLYNSEQPQFIIINEAQALTEKAKDLSILRPLLEQTAPNVHVILTSNSSFIDLGINSRAVSIHLGKYKAERWVTRLEQILEAEGIKCNSELALKELAELVGGDVRELLKIFDELIFAFNELNPPTASVCSDDIVEDTAI